MSSAEYQRKWKQRNKERWKEYQKNWYDKNKEKEILRGKKYRASKIGKQKCWEYQLKKQFGENAVEKYNELFKIQKGLCAICGLPETRKIKKTRKRLAVDHNHNTDKIRGLLCHKCNTAIGMLNVDNLGILNLETAIKYLKF